MLASSLAKRKVIEKGAQSVGDARQPAANQSHRKDVEVLTVEQDQDQQENSCCKTCAQRNDRKRREAQRNSQFPEDGSQSEKYC